MVDYLSLLSKYTKGEHEQTVPAFIIHSALVTKKALDIANKHMQATGEHIDMKLLEEMGMLHDIGIFKTQEQKLFTTGTGPYIKHLTYGEEILVQEGLQRHAKGARNHANITREEISQQELDLPSHDHVPETAEEEILHIADQFYSKQFSNLFTERSYEEICSYLDQYKTKKQRFMRLYATYCKH